MKKRRIFVLITIISLLGVEQLYATDNLFINGVASEAELLRTHGYQKAIESDTLIKPISKFFFVSDEYVEYGDMESSKKLTISTGIAAASGLVLIGLGAIAFSVSNSFSANSEADEKQAWFITGAVTGGLGALAVIISTPIALYSGLSWIIGNRQNRRDSSDEIEDW